MIIRKRKKKQKSPPQFLRKTISRLPHAVRKHVIKLIHNNRSKLLNAGISFVKTPKKKFEATLDRFINEALTRFEHVFVVNICPTNKETENHSPGLTNNINEYNQIISRSTKNNFCHLIDINSAIINNGNISDIILEDGHHINKTGHNIIFNLINKNFTIN